MGDIAVRQVGHEREPHAVAHPPTRRQQAIRGRAGLATGGADEARGDLLAADREQIAHQVEPLLRRSLPALVPIEYGRLKRR